MSSELASATSGLAAPRDDSVEATGGGRFAELQRTWVSVLRARWSTLAVVATDPRTNAFELANALAEAARAYRLGSVRVLNGCGDSAQPTRLLEALAQTRGTEVRTAIALDDTFANPERGPVLFAADAVLLVVTLGSARIRSIEAAVEFVGRQRVLGCVTVRP